MLTQWQRKTNVCLSLICFTFSYVGIMVNEHSAHEPIVQMFVSKVWVSRKGKNRKIQGRDSSRWENLGHDSEPPHEPHHLLSETLQFSPLPQPPHSHHLSPSPAS